MEDRYFEAGQISQALVGLLQLRAGEFEQRHVSAATGSDQVSAFAAHAYRVDAEGIVVAEQDLLQLLVVGVAVRSRRFRVELDVRADVLVAVRVGQGVRRGGVDLDAIEQPVGT